MRRALVWCALAACGGAPAPRPPAPRPPTAQGSAAAPAPAPAPAVTWDQLHGPIRSFAILGGESIDYLRLQPLFNDEVGKPLDRARLRGKLARAMEPQTLANLELRGEQLADGIKLVVVVTPQPIVRALAVRDGGGAAQPVPPALAHAVGQRLAPAELERTVLALRAGYANEGRVGFAASWTAEPSGDGVAVTIAAVEGEILRIATRTFEGAAHAPRAELEKIVASDAAIGAAWVPEKITRAALGIQAWYWDHGYANVRLQVSPQPAGNPAALVFQIQEGEVFHLGAIAVTGVPPPEAKRLRALAKLQTGAVFNRTAIANARDQLTAEVVRGGHAQASVLPLTKVDVPKREIGLTFEITPGP